MFRSIFQPPPLNKRRLHMCWNKSSILTLAILYIRTLLPILYGSNWVSSIRSYAAGAISSSFWTNLSKHLGARQRQSLVFPNRWPLRRSGQTGIPDQGHPKHTLIRNRHYQMMKKNKVPVFGVSKTISVDGGGRKNSRRHLKEHRLT